MKPSYHDYDAMSVLLGDKIVKSCPDVAKATSLGMSGEGRNILALEFTADQASADPHRVHVGLIGGLQGTDMISREVLVRFAVYLCNGYNRSDSRIVNLLQTTSIHILPSVDIDGNEKAIEGDCSGKIDPQDDMSRDFFYQQPSRHKRDLPPDVQKVTNRSVKDFCLTWNFLGAKRWSMIHALHMPGKVYDYFIYLYMCIAHVRIMYVVYTHNVRMHTFIRLCVSMCVKLCMYLLGTYKTWRIQYIHTVW